MQDSMYSALFGAMTQEHRLDLIANNLANVNTTGYKKDQQSFKDVFIKFAHDTIMEPVMNVRSKKLFPEPIEIAKPRLAESRTNFEQGSMRLTNGPLDLAISGEGFFKVRTAFGDFLTRNGHFHVTSEGQLVTANGEEVLGDGGPITLPQGASNVFINQAGEIFANGDAVGALQIVSVDNLTALEKQGHNLYQIANGSTAQEIPAENARVEQGYLEASNVEVVSEMVNMIETQRQFEAYQKMMQTTDELDTKVITRVGKAT